MSERPHVVLSCAISVDGCLDAPGPQRLILSSGADLERVDGVRAASDAVMVGAGTLRRDDPRLLVRSAKRRAERVARGLPEHPARVTVTASGDLDPRARFFQGPSPSAPGPAPERLVYCPPPVAPGLRMRLNGRARVVCLEEPGGLGAVLADLAARGFRRLLVEGGAGLARELLTSDLVDELHLVVAPFFVGDASAPRFAAPGQYPRGPGRPMRLAETRRLGEVVLLRYLLGADHAPGGLDAAGTGPEAGRRE